MAAIARRQLQKSEFAVTAHQAASARRSRHRLATTIAALALLLGAIAPAQAAETVRVLLDRPIDAASAPILTALDQNLFRAEDLNVNVIPSNGAANGNSDAISRLAAGEGDVALADINALIRYRDRANAAEIKAVYVVFNAAGYAIMARKSRGIQDLDDLDGKSLGYAEGDPATAFWPALARLNNVPRDQVRLQRIGAAVREPMLSAGQIDAVMGLAYLSPVNLKDRGIPAADLAVFRYDDFGVAAYGLAVLVGPKFAIEKPEVVRGFLRAVNAALRLAIRSPAKAVDDVLAHMPSGVHDVELERLRSILDNNVLTEEVRRNGLGGIDAERFAATADLLAEGIKLRKKPALADIFDGSFLPPQASRTLQQP